MKPYSTGVAILGALVLTCFASTLAVAGSHKRAYAHSSSTCCKGAKVQKRKLVVECGKYCAIFTALSAKSFAHVSRDKGGKWHGWVASRRGFAFYMNGSRYKGGLPCGPPMAYNNWEGGFNRRAFWEITDRDRY
jgi:hypothetical protein